MHFTNGILCVMRILLFDIESTPNLGYSWGKWETNVLGFVRETYMLCYAYKWYGEEKTQVVSLPDFALYKKERTNDRALVKSLWNLFNEADVIIAHNGDKFDIKYTNGRFLAHGMKPPTTYKTIDTLKVARSKFKLNSNSLNDLGAFLKVGKKVETGGFDLWLGCMANDKGSWKKMIEYNKQDVDLLEAVYDKLRPWVKNHPNLTFEGAIIACPHCQSEKLWKIGKDKFSYKQRWRCQGCGANVYTTVKNHKPKSE